MTRHLIAATAALLFANQHALAATSVATATGGSISYDAATATMTAVHNFGSARLLNSAAAFSPTIMPAVATLKISFAAPLLRTNEIVESQWTASGHRYIASFVRGTAIGFEYSTNSLPDAGGNTTNLLTIKSQPGFSVPFISLEQLSYYIDSNGNTSEGYAILYNQFEYFYDLAFVGLFPPCNCIDGNPFGPAITTFSAASDIGDYVQNIYPQSNGFRLSTNGTGYNLYNVTAPSVTAATSFTVGSVAEWSPAIPEPASWAMMITGFGLVGTSLRRRRQQALA